MPEILTTEGCMAEYSEMLHVWSYLKTQKCPKRDRFETKCKVRLLLNFPAFSLYRFPLWFSVMSCHVKVTGTLSKKILSTFHQIIFLLFPKVCTFAMVCFYSLANEIHHTPRLQRRSVLDDNITIDVDNFLTALDSISQLTAAQKRELHLDAYLLKALVKKVRYSTFYLLSPFFTHYSSFHSSP